MKHMSKIILLLLISIFLFVGCDKINFNTFDASKQEEEQEKTNQSKENENEEKNHSSTDEEPLSMTMENNEEEVPTPKIQPKANSELIIYTINSDTSEIEPLTALVSADREITPELVIEKTVESLADRSFDVGIDQVTTKDDIVIVSFKSDKAPITNVGSGFEVAILDSIAQSLVENLDEYKKVIFRIEGEAYASGHMEFSIDEVYLGD